MEILSGNVGMLNSNIAIKSEPELVVLNNEETDSVRQPIPTLKISGGRIVSKYIAPEEIQVEPELSTYYDYQYEEYYNNCNQSQNTNSNYENWYDYQPTEEPSIKYEYKEPDENFISIDELKIKPTQLPTIIRPPKPKEQLAMISTDVVKTELEEEIGDDDDVIIIEDDDEEIDENEVGEELDWMDLEQGKQLFECFLCNRKVASNYNLRRHMMIHTGERPFGCDICLKRFREFSDLKKHRRVHSNDVGFKCMVCHKNTPSLTNAVKCSSCDKQDKQSRSPFREFFAEVPLLEGSQKKAYVCPVCDRIFGSRHNLKRHFMIHTGEKPFKCDVCKKRFREVSTLKKHILTHSRIKLFNCNVCNKEYSDFGSYTRHKALHGDGFIQGDDNSAQLNGDNIDGEIENEYLFECTDCQKKFTTASVYKDHLKLHTKDFTFQCFICKKMFRTKEKLNSHFVIHSYDDDADEECGIL